MYLVSCIHQNGCTHYTGVYNHFGEPSVAVKLTFNVQIEINHSSVCNTGTINIFTIWYSTMGLYWALQHQWP